MAHMYQKAIKTCSVHMNKQLTVYCYDCKKIVCFQCFNENHSEHKCDDVVSAARDIKTSMLEQCRATRENSLPAIHSTIDDIRSKETLSSENYKRFLEEIDAKEEDAIHALKRAFSKHRKDAHDQQENISSTVTDRIKTLQDLHADIDRRTKTLEDEFTVLTDIDVLELNQELNDKLLLVPQRTGEIPIFDVRFKTKKMSTPTVQLLTDIVNDIFPAETTPKKKEGSSLLKVQMIRRSGPSPSSDMARAGERVYKKREKSVFVASLEIGSGYSRIAFSTIDKPITIFSAHWGGGRRMISSKFPTCILMKSDLQMVAVGFDAESRYTELKEDKDYCFFNDLHTALYQGKISARDVRGSHEMPVNVLWEGILRFLNEKLLQSIQKNLPEFELKDIDFVIPIPSIWKDSTFEFVRQIFYSEGINPDRLLFITEAEAALVYAERHGLKEIPTMSLKEGERVIVVDIGISSKFACLIKEKTSYREVAEPALVTIGGHSVNDAFEIVLEEIIGADTYGTFKTAEPKDHLDMMDEFESTKMRKLSKKSSGNMYLSIPRSLYDILEEREIELVNLILQSKYNRSVTHRDGRLEINVAIKKIVSDVIESIIKHLGDFLEMNTLQNVDTIILVGGFSECDLLQKELKDSFSKKIIQLPVEGGMAILKGSVHFGHYYYS